MASNYNTRPRAPEVLVSGDSWQLVRARETVDELLANERVPDGQWMAAAEGEGT
jgi:diaminopimelate decarboxylase